MRDEFAIENSNNLDLPLDSPEEHPSDEVFGYCGRRTECKLWMVWLVSPVGVKNFLAVRSVVVFAGNFSRYKRGINLDKYPRIIKSHRPTTLTAVFLEKAQA